MTGVRSPATYVGHHLATGASRFARRIHSFLVSDGPRILYSTPPSIHRISDVPPPGLVVISAGYPLASLTAVDVPSVPGLPFKPTQCLIIVWNSGKLSSGASSYSSTSPADVLYCSTTTLCARGRSGVSRIRNGSESIGIGRRRNITFRWADLMDASATPPMGLLQLVITSPGSASVRFPCWADCPQPLVPKSIITPAARQAPTGPSGRRPRELCG